MMRLAIIGLSVAAFLAIPVSAMAQGAPNPPLPLPGPTVPGVAPSVSPAPEVNVLPSPVCSDGVCSYPDPTTPTPAATNNGCGVLGVNCLIGSVTGLPNKIADAIWSRFTSGMRSRAIQQIEDGIKTAMAVLRTPDFASQKRVQELWWLTLGLVNGSAGLLTLALSAGGLASMIPEVTGLEAKIVIPRFFVAWAMADLSLFLLAGATFVSNYFLVVFARVTPDQVQLAANRIIGANIPWLIADAFWFASILLLIVTIFRLILLVLLGVAAPLAQATWIFPQTAEIAKAWWKAVVALLLAPIIQMLVLTIGVWVFFTGNSILGGGALVDACTLLALFIIEIAIPIFFLRYATRPAVKAIRTVAILSSGAGMATAAGAKIWGGAGAAAGAMRAGASTAWTGVRTWLP